MQIYLDNDGISRFVNKWLKNKLIVNSLLNLFKISKKNSPAANWCFEKFD